MPARHRAPPLVPPAARARHPRPTLCSRTNTNCHPHAAAFENALTGDSWPPCRYGADATWTGLARPRLSCIGRELGVKATCSNTVHGTTYVTAAFPAEVDALAVEPQTHAPQGLRRLMSGEPVRLRGWSPGGELTLTTRSHSSRSRRVNRDRQFFNAVPSRSHSAVWARTIRSASRSTSPTAWCSASAWRITSASPCASGIRSTGPAPMCSEPGTFDRPWLANPDGMARRA